MECSEIIKSYLDKLKCGFKCVPYQGRLCIVTPYLYPDNDLIEIFIEDLGSGRVRVSDLGETLRHLETLGLDLFASRKRRFLLEQITKRIHVNINQGNLEKEGQIIEVGYLLSDVAEASHCVADLIYTSKAYEPATFPEEVSKYLADNDIKHDRNYEVTGETGTKYRVNIRIFSKDARDVLVETLSPPQEGGMTTTINRTFRKWYDVDGERKKISLINDVDYMWKPEDAALLQKVSVLHKWTQKDALLDYISSFI